MSVFQELNSSNPVQTQTNAKAEQGMADVGFQIKSSFKAETALTKLF